MGGMRRNNVNRGRTIRAPPAVPGIPRGPPGGGLSRIRPEGLWIARAHIDVDCYIEYA